MPLIWSSARRFGELDANCSGRRPRRSPHRQGINLFRGSGPRAPVAGRCHLRRSVRGSPRSAHPHGVPLSKTARGRGERTRHRRRGDHGFRRRRAAHVWRPYRRRGDARRRSVSAIALEVVRFAIPQQHLQLMVYQGRTVDPELAHAIGIIDRVVVQEGLPTAAHALATHLAAIPPDVFRMTKLEIARPSYAMPTGLRPAMCALPGPHRRRTSGSGRMWRRLSARRTEDCGLPARLRSGILPDRFSELMQSPGWKPGDRRAGCPQSYRSLLHFATPQQR